MTQYLLSVHHPTRTPMPEPDEMAATFADVDAFNQELQGSGAWVFAGGLEAPGHRHRRPDQRRAGGAQRRPVRGVQGAPRRLLGDRGGRPRRRAARGPSRVPARAARRWRSARFRRSPSPQTGEPDAGERDRAGLPRGVLARDRGADRPLPQHRPRRGGGPGRVPDRRRRSGRRPVLRPIPGAWITTTARNRAIDVLRRESTPRPAPERSRSASRRRTWMTSSIRSATTACGCCSCAATRRCQRRRRSR